LALVDGVPRTLTLKACLQHCLNPVCTASLSDSFQVALVAGVPRTLTLKACLQHFLGLPQYHHAARSCRLKACL
jgi:hypothetical protein